jgi:hypothetical protein
MALFTVILDYRGGTYVSQVEASGPRAALLAWAAALDPRQVKFLGERRKQKLIRELELDEYDLAEPVALDGLRNVWCTDVSLPPFALVNIVATVADA